MPTKSTQALLITLCLILSWPSYAGDLHVAARAGDLTALTAQLDAGLDPNIEDENGFTALEWAATRGHAGIITALIKAGANPDSGDDDGFQALHGATRNGHVAAATALLDGGANPNARDKYSNTALDYISKTSPLYHSDLWWRLHKARSDG